MKTRNEYFVMELTDATDDLPGAFHLLGTAHDRDAIPEIVDSRPLDSIRVIVGRMLPLAITTKTRVQLGERKPRVAKGSGKKRGRPAGESAK